MKKEKTPKSKRYKKLKRKKVLKVFCGLTLLFSLACGAYMNYWYHYDDYNTGADGLWFVKKAIEADLLGEVPPEQVYLLGESIPDLHATFSVEKFLQGLLPLEISGETVGVTEQLTPENEKIAYLLGDLYQENVNWRTEGSSSGGDNPYVSVTVEMFPLELWGDFTREDLDGLWEMLEESGNADVNAFYNYVLPQILSKVQEDLAEMDAIPSNTTEYHTIQLGVEDTGDYFRRLYFLDHYPVVLDFYLYDYYDNY